MGCQPGTYSSAESNKKPALSLPAFGTLVADNLGSCYSLPIGNAPYLFWLLPLHWITYQWSTTFPLLALAG